MRDLVHRLPEPDNVKVEENTVGAILCAIHQVVNKSIENSRCVVAYRSLLSDEGKFYLVVIEKSNRKTERFL